MWLDDRMTLARRAATEGSRRARMLKDRSPTNWRKGDGSVVSAADIDTERAVRSLLLQECPHDAVLGEEDGLSGQSRDSCWIVDPIDGTTNYLSGMPIWATMVAWVEEGITQCAAISAPELDAEWHAVKHGGSFKNGNPISVTDHTTLRNARMSVGGWHEYSDAGLKFLAQLTDDADFAWGIGNFWAHALVAEGCLELGLSVGTNIWDTLAPALLVEEAGGMAGSIVKSETRPTSTLMTGTPGVWREALFLAGDSSDTYMSD